MILKMQLKSLKRLMTILRVKKTIKKLELWVPNEEIGMGRAELKELESLIEELKRLWDD